MITTQDTTSTDEKYASIADLIHERYDEADVNHERRARNGKAERKAFRNVKLNGGRSTTGKNSLNNRIVIK